MNKASTPLRLVIATRNQGKAREMKMILGDTSLEILSLDNFGDVGEAPEAENSYAGNAAAKAGYYAVATGEWVLADDSGMEVVALNGAPGLLSARYAGPKASDADRRLKVLQDLASTSAVDRKARFVCAVAFARPSGEIVKITEGFCEGKIIGEPRGISGFGYDPIFVPEAYTQTFAELTEEVKNEISHRAKALSAMRGYLVEEFGPLDRVSHES